MEGQDTYSDKGEYTPEPLDKGKSMDIPAPLDKSKSMDIPALLDKGKDKEIPVPLDKDVEKVTPLDGKPKNWFTKDQVPKEPFVFPKRTNPGPGFNVPGGVVPIHDDICKSIDYNGHILNQFRNMDLETAKQQIDNYQLTLRNLNHKMVFAEKTFASLPEIPTTEREFKLKNTIIKDLNELNTTRIRSEDKVTLLKSRVEFIQIELNNIENKKKGN